jgi:hypothetical protein
VVLAVRRRATWFVSLQHVATRGRETGVQHRLATLTAALGTAAKRRGAALADDPALRQALSALHADHPAPRKASPDDRLAALGSVFGLDELDRALLWIAAAADFDVNVGIAYGRLTGKDNVSAPTVGLALELAGIGSGDPRGFDRLGPAGRLRLHRLVEVSTAEPWLARTLRTPHAVTAALAEAISQDPATAALAVAAVPLDLPGIEEIIRAVDAGIAMVWIHSVHGAAGVSLAAGALDRLGVAMTAVDLRLLLGREGADSAAASVVTAVEDAVRDAGLRGCALIITGAEVLAERTPQRAFIALERSPVPVFAVSTKPWNPSWRPNVPMLVEADRLDPSRRTEVWQANLGDVASDDADLRETLLGIRMTPEAVAEAARYARVVSVATGVPVTADVVREAVRRTSGPGGAGQGLVNSRGADTGPSFDDLLLPPATKASLRQLVSWARHRDEVSAHGLVQRAGRGIAALFAGNPGTGKTLAANIVARELSIDLFQVELSAVVDKYIGETEKNLEKVFEAAEAMDVVLFFDEADALFGSRSEVHDAHDRYANQEIAYLLQRMEQFDGITILATNLRGNLDRAFSRRMSFIINFPDPDVPTRRELWAHHLQQLAELDRADAPDLDFLAETVELTGGDIRNIVRAAAYDAVGVKETVGMRHLSAAAAAEYRKLGRVLPDHAFAVSARDAARAKVSAPPRPAAPRR